MKSIIAFGDSVLKGVIIDKERSGNDSVRYTCLEDNFTTLCGKRLGLDVHNYGKFGSTVDTGEKMMKRHLDAISKADFTLLEYGGNDCDHNWEEIAAAPNEAHKPKNDLRTFSLKYKELIDEVSRLGSSPIMLSLTPLDPERYFNHFTGSMDKRQKQSAIFYVIS